MMTCAIQLMKWQILGSANSSEARFPKRNDLRQYLPIFLIGNFGSYAYRSTVPTL